MGVAYQMLLDEKDATRCYKQALKMDPQNANVLNNLATVQDSMMDLAAAEENYRKALKYDPDSAIIHSNLGTNLFLQHKDEEGDEAYRQALTLNPHIFDKNSGPTASNPEAAQELGTTAYYKAKSCARAGLDDCALTYLRKAFDDGAITIKKVSKESDFARLRATEAYSGLIAQEQ
jgi:Tfp pilus assembly protein PilF